MAPAQQRLDADQIAAEFEDHLRLVVDLQLPVGERMTQRGLQLLARGAAPGPCRARRSRRGCDRRTSRDRARYPRSAVSGRRRRRRPGIMPDPDAGADHRFGAVDDESAPRVLRECDRTAIARRAVVRTSLTSTANSSPPRRATRSVSRTQPRRRSAQSTSTRSPAAWPRLSLISLNRSRSMHSTAARSIVPLPAQTGRRPGAREDEAVGQSGEWIMPGEKLDLAQGRDLGRDVRGGAAIAGELAVTRRRPAFRPHAGCGCPRRRAGWSRQRTSRNARVARRSARLLRLPGFGRTAEDAVERPP